jgi:hypothetical protein
MRSRLFAGLVAAATFAACNSGTEKTYGQLTVELTDAPNPMIESATAYISSVYLTGGGDDGDSTGGHTVISSASQSYDLLDLTNGVTATLGSATIPTGTYSQLRLVVDSATITLKDPYKFADGTSTRSLKTPSAQQSGIKVNFSGALVIPEGSTTVVVDFDVSRNFLFIGPDSTAPESVMFKPVLHASVKDESGSISGVVTPASAHAVLYAIKGPDTVRTTLADTITGAYTLHFLPAGNYVVKAVGTGLDASKLVVLAASQDTTGVNFP